LKYKTKIIKIKKKIDEKRAITPRWEIKFTSKLQNDPWVVPFQNCVRQRRPVSKMAAITKNRNYLKWPTLLYVKPESAQI
jgi:hypothetical protein